MSKTLCISVNDIKFDPEDELTPKFNKETVVYYFYVNQDLIGQSNLQNGYKTVQVPLSVKILQDAKNVMRIIARDHGLTQEGGEFVQVGTISMNIENYFKNFSD
jgi:hypothetical protein